MSGAFPKRNSAAGKNGPYEVEDNSYDLGRLKRNKSAFGIVFAGMDTTMLMFTMARLHDSISPW